jgi:hypothetical protein
MVRGLEEEFRSDVASCAHRTHCGKIR